MNQELSWSKSDTLLTQAHGGDLVHSSLQLSCPATYLAIVYKHSRNIRRTVFCTEDFVLLSNEPLMSLFSMLPGLESVISEICSNFARSKCILLADSSIYLTHQTRGSQSFAFGHFIIDILPYLFYCNLVNNFNAYSPLIYQPESWQESLLTTCFPKRPPLAYFTDLRPFFSNSQIDAYKLTASVAYLENWRQVLVALQHTVSSDLFNIYNPSSLDQTGILFLMRENLVGRSDRWINADQCYSALKETFSDKLYKLNPVDIMPEYVAQLVHQTRLTITAAGSAAYNSLLFGSAKHLTVLVVPYQVDSPLIWNFTLRMFVPFSHKLILISSREASAPSSEAWDFNTSLNHMHFTDTIKKILDFSPYERLVYPDLSKRRIFHNLSLVVNFPH